MFNKEHTNGTTTYLILLWNLHIPLLFHFSEAWAVLIRWLLTPVTDNNCKLFIQKLYNHCNYRSVIWITLYEHGLHVFYHSIYVMKLTKRKLFSIPKKQKKKFEYLQYFLLNVDHTTLYPLKVMEYKHKSTKTELHTHNQMHICQN
jgi:hypothetical protein